jgi:F0F1-type ATP synthase assembly protein I
MESASTPHSEKNNAPKSSKSAMRELAPLLGMGTELAGTVGLFGVIGWFIDKYAATAPFWFITLLITGIVVGMVKMLQTVIKSGVLKSNSTKSGMAKNGTTESKQ